MTAEETATRQATLREAIMRVQSMRDETDAEYSDAEPESTAQEALYVERETLDRVLDVLQILYHGGAPLQGGRIVSSGGR